MQHIDMTVDGGSGKVPDSGAAPVLQSGIPGLDNILGGGFPAQRLFLIEGEPGAGKTTLSMQFLLEGVARGEQVLYVTLSETTHELEVVARSHGWSLETISVLDLESVPNLAEPEAQYTVFHPSEVELQDSVAAVLARAEEVKPARVVLDSLTEMRLLARDSLRFRRQILALKKFFAARGATVLMLDDVSPRDAEMQLHSLVHGVIQLEHSVLSHGAERRRLRATKLRGVNFHAGYHDYTIRKGGLEVFPRIRLGVNPPALVPAVDSCGSRQLDALLGGGLVRGASILVTGAPGTGKSVLTTQFAVAAAERGHRTAIYLFDERMGTFLERAKGLGMSIEKHIQSGHLMLTQLEPTELSPGEFTSRVLRNIHEDGVCIVVVDSLNGFTKAMAEESDLAIKIHELLSYLGGHGVTTIMTLAQRGIFGAPPDDVTDVSYLADGVVLLRYFESQGAVRRAISVVKQRTGNHEQTIREFRIERGGFMLGEPLNEFQGVLTGVPTYTGREAALMNNAEASNQ